MNRAAALAATAALAVGAAGAAPAIAVPVDGAFEERTLVDGLSAPTAIDWAPDGRMFVAEKYGRVWVVNADGTQEPRPLVDISAHVNPVWDRGLMGIAVDADFAENGFLYLYYALEDNPYDKDAPKVSRVSRVVVQDDNTVANPSSPETVILGTHGRAPCPPPSNDVDCIPADYLFHHVGTIRADDDGTLWIGTGDAASITPGDPHFRTYDERSLAGKIIHVDRNGRGLPGHPFCPAETNLARTCTKLYAKGLRNPFRFTLRPGGRGPILGDVGLNSREEIDLGEPGADYGWPCYEGDIRTPEFRDHPRCQERYAQAAAGNPVTPPLYAYRGPSNSPGAVLGGPVYDGGEYPASFADDFFFSDYSYAVIRRLPLDADGRLEGTRQPIDFAHNLRSVDLALSPSDGRLVYVAFGAARPGAGAIREIAYSPDNKTPVARIAPSATYGPLPLTVRFDGRGSTDADRDPLTYRWDFGDGTTATGPTAAHTYHERGRFVAKLEVDDGRGRRSTDAVAIHPGNAPPTVTIESPADGGTVIPGEVLRLRGRGSDPQDGPLTGAALAWHAVLHHGTHVHDLQNFSGTDAEFATDAPHGSEAYYEVFLTATDSGGLGVTRSVSVYPPGYAASGAPSVVTDPQGIGPMPFMADKQPGRITLRVRSRARLLRSGHVRLRLRPTRTARVRLRLALRARTRTFRFRSAPRTLRAGRWTAIRAKAPRKAARAARRVLARGGAVRLRISGGAVVGGRRLKIVDGVARLRR